MQPAALCDGCDWCVNIGGKNHLNKPFIFRVKIIFFSKRKGEKSEDLFACFLDKMS